MQRPSQFAISSDVQVEFAAIFAKNIFLLGKKKKKVRCSINQSDHAWTFQLWKAINNFRIFNSILSICVLDFSAPLMRPSGVNKEGEEVGGLPAQSLDAAPFCPQNAKNKTQNINKSTWNEFP